VTARLYAASVRRAVARGGLSAVRIGSDDRLVFVVGSPRSGTTFLGESVGGVPGFVDLGEVAPLKAAIPELVSREEAAAAARMRQVLDRVRRLGLVTGLRAVEQTPETSFVLRAALRAYPRARALHIVRDGRDVVCSLLERGWLRADRTGRDDAGLAYGARARFWVDAERRGEFERANEATRAAWAWRAYVSAARTAVDDRTLELRYEALAAEREATAERIARHLGISVEPVLARLGAAHESSIGRFRRDLTPEQLADVQREAGALLDELGYRS
jgi:hypothetical protein